VNGGDALLKGLGLPEPTAAVTATDGTVPTTAEAGRVLLHLINQTGTEVDSSLGRTPEAVTDEENLAIGDSDTVPDWFWDTEFIGGAAIYPPATDGYSVIDLPAGAWKMVTDR